MWISLEVFSENFKVIHIGGKDKKGHINIHSLSTYNYTGYCGLIFFFNISIVFCKVGSFGISLEIFSMPWMTVVWSLPPKNCPICWRGVLVILRHKYITIWRAPAISLFRFCPKMSMAWTPKWSETIWSIRSGVTSLATFGEIRSFKASSANSMVISFLSSLEKLPLTHGYWI